MIRVQSGVAPVSLDEAVLFPFDDHSVPLTYGLRLVLVPGKKPGTKNPVTLRAGEDGKHDGKRVTFYGTVIRVGEEYRMWYCGTDGEFYPVCYAVSSDGISWKKPDLGLVEYKGTKHNNIVDLPLYEWFFEYYRGVITFVVLYEPEDPDPGRRFKIIFESGKYQSLLGVAFSPDGLKWQEYPNNPVSTDPLEISGLLRFNGCYYVNGQLIRRRANRVNPVPGRTMLTLASYDFEHWTEAMSLSFCRRDQLLYSPAFGEEEHLGSSFQSLWNAGEQVHQGAGLWNRGNVIIGIYDQWHGNDEDRAFIDMDLGLVVSNDGIHFREPAPDFRMVPAYEELETEGLTQSAITHGQGLENIGDKTFLWYGIWYSNALKPPKGGVRLATWIRDRLGYFELIAGYKGKVVPHFISCPLELESPARVYVNADGLSGNSHLKVEVCDYKFVKLAGYSGGDSVPVQASGLRIPVKWRNKETIEKFGFPIRLRVNFEGLRPEDIRVYTVYITAGSGT